MQKKLTHFKDEKRVVGNPEPTQSEIGDLIVSYLKQLDVDFVFGVPGGAIEPIYNALARSARAGGPRPIVARHETGAAFMADGYARTSGKLAVCCSTTGPGATNLITGVASARENHIPMLVITAQTALSTFGAGAFQESSCTGVDVVGMFEFCTCYNSLVSHVDQVERKLNAALMKIYQTSCPAHLSFPLDVLRSPSPRPQPSWDISKHLGPSALMDTQAVDVLCREILDAKKLVIIIGDDCSEAIGTILEVAVLSRAQILTTPHGKGLVSPYHPLYRGVIGFAGHRTAEQVLEDSEVDIILAIGTPLSEWASNGWDPLLLNNRLIHVEATEPNLARSPMARLHVRGCINSIFQTVVDRIYAHGCDGGSHLGIDLEKARQAFEVDSKRWLKRHFELDDEAKYEDDSTPIKPQRLMRELPRLFPPHTRYLADTGASFAWAIHYLHPFDRRISGERDARGGGCRVCLEFSSMGWAIGSAVGTALARRGEPVVCLTGDGALLMSGQEITVAIQEKIPVIFVILNDAALGMVKHGQRMANAEQVGTELPKANYAQFAKSLGAEGYIIRSPEDLLKIDIDQICKRAGPTLLDVRIDPEEVPPIRVRMRGLLNKGK
ncbi:MAG: thiamine pyrophosphate-binding protein [Pseudomonadota bacterium]